MSEDLNEAIAWLTEHIDMREHVRSDRAHEMRKHLDAITAARARIAELEAQVKRDERRLDKADMRLANLTTDYEIRCAQLLATQRALVRAMETIESWDLYHPHAERPDIVAAARAAVAQADGKEAV